MRMSAVAAVAIGLMVAPAFAGRVAYVDYAQLARRAPQTAASRDLVQKEFAGRRKAIIAKRAQVKKLRQEFLDLGPGTNDLEMVAVQEKLRNARSALRRSEAAYESSLQLRVSALRASYRNLVRREIAAYAQAHGIVLVLREGVSFAAPGTDITDAILAQLQRAYHKTTAGAETHKGS